MEGARGKLEASGRKEGEGIQGERQGRGERIDRGGGREIEWEGGDFFYLVICASIPER